MEGKLIGDQFRLSVELNHLKLTSTEVLLILPNNLSKLSPTHTVSGMLSANKSGFTQLGFKIEEIAEFEQANLLLVLSSGVILICAV